MQLETYNKHFYMSLCGKDEIERIFDVKNEKDYLLKLRANATIENIRIHRVFLARMREGEDKWSFEASFNYNVFDRYLDSIRDEDREKVANIASGLVFCNDPNGRIISTPYGNIITLSESLRYFLYFMNLSFLSFNSEAVIPDNVRYSALKIALRIMLKSEALDFDIDPRGIIPEEIDRELSRYVDDQMLFLIAHEYSHYLLGHMDDPNLIDDTMHHAIENIDGKTPKYFTHSQHQELDADIDAINRQDLTDASLHRIVTAAIFFFAYIDILKNVREQISPSFTLIKTHPEPIDRLNNLIEFFEEKCGLDKENVNILLKSVEVIKNILQDDIATDFDNWEQYGSVYLGEWRGKPLVDRIDY
ncbi:hypothetical protein [Leclercia sp. LSNIH1]|uniref:hypothetical protein n=1 Tax=Leclercia sp. LSNIH1 TaxID=1920114 RepID=UPI000CD17C3A|nr:hypothetical protein [Leclercia sp. LSNIH1]AUU83864.1 hypothetical protein C2U54_07470 [Leclercia sp. LSNIH1]POV32116.1 hypothetical protein C3388_22990 [Leclercia sp. LSNIH5]POW61472.1 hypothetical protein C3389_22650 [Leclercia sp. LSNIH2]